jgi:hypothetical protein
MFVVDVPNVHREGSHVDGIGTRTVPPVVSDDGTETTSSDHRNVCVCAAVRVGIG